MNKGITLIELMITLLICVILIVAAIPTYSYFSNKNALIVRQNEILLAIKFARKQSVLYGKPIVLSKHQQCDDWSCGMLLFVNNRGNNQFELNDELLHHWKWDKSKVLVKWKGFSSDDYIVFMPQLSNSLASGTFTLSINEGKTSSITMNRFGRTRVYL
jgi:Tfp pilus assembly protein FimT